MTAIWLLNKTADPNIIKSSQFAIGSPDNASAYGLDWPTLVANIVPEVSGNLVAGANQEIQFNEGGVFGANAALKYDYNNNVLTVDAGEVIANLFNGVALTDAGAGNLWLDNSGNYSAPVAVPAGINFNVQFNDGGVLAGDNNFNWNKATAQLTLSGSVVANLFNGVALTDAGVATDYLDATGNYSTPPLTPPAGNITELQFNNGGVFGSDANLTWDGASLDALAFNGVALTSVGAATNYLDATGNYSVPVSNPGGADTQIQFNNAGVLDGSGNLTWDGASLDALAFNGVALTTGGAIGDFLNAQGNYIAAMRPSIYDPTNKQADVYDKANEIGVEQITGAIITPPALAAQANNYNPAGFSTANMVRQNIVGGDQNISGFVAPPVGVNRIIHINQVSTTGDRLGFLHNNAASLAANRILLRDNGDRQMRENETASFWYDHTSQRWRPLSRIG